MRSGKSGAPTEAACCVKRVIWVESQSRGTNHMKVLLITVIGVKCMC